MPIIMRSEDYLRALPILTSAENCRSAVDIEFGNKISEKLENTRELMVKNLFLFLSLNNFD